MGKMLEPSFWEQSPPPQTGDMNAARTLNQRAIRELPGALQPEDVVIQDGKISGFASAALIVDTEGVAAADDLDVINIVLAANENLHPGMLITLRAKDPARVVTIKNSVSPNGINTANGNDIVLSPDWELTLRLVGGKWYEVRGRSSAVADAAKAVTDTVTPTPTPYAVPQAGEDGEIWGLAKRDMNNLTKTGTTAIAHYASPSVSGRIAVAGPATSGGKTVPMPSSGWLQGYGPSSSVGGNIGLQTYSQVQQSASAPNVGYSCLCSINVAKGEQVTVSWYGMSSVTLFFTPDKGAA